MLRKTRLLLLAVCFFIAACSEGGSRLPFPTPARQDLVVLTQPGLLTYDTDDNDNPTGLEYDLLQTFAQELGVSVRFTVAEPGELEADLAGEQYHLAAAWLPPGRDPAIQATPPIFMTRDILVQHDASLPLTDTNQLTNKTVHVMADSRQADTLRELAKKISGLKVVEFSDGDVVELLENLGAQRIHYVAIDENLQDIASQFVPNLRSTLPLSEAQPVVWRLGHHPNPELRARLTAFIERIQHDGTLARLEDRYLGHVQRLTQGDIVKFLGEVETTLPRFRKFFQAAQALTGIDWRLLAAIAYHESNWDPNATSFTNVRGIMMLTEETADRLQVSNRLDASESILAGARYLNMLKEQLPDEVEEPDRTWLALAGYNIGAGHLNGARWLARQLHANPNSWYDMKGVLPRLTQPEYYRQLKSGRGRGGEAVILVENIRSYYDILQRYAEPFAPSPSAAESLKRLVIEIEGRRKAYVKRMSTAKTVAAPGKNDSDQPKPRLPTIGQDSGPADKE